MTVCVKVPGASLYRLSGYCCLVTQSCLTLCNLIDLAHQAPLSLEFSRQEYCSDLPFLPLGDLPKPRINATPPALAGGFFNH